MPLLHGIAEPSRLAVAASAAAACDGRRHPQQQGEANGLGDASHVQLVIRSRGGDAGAFAALVDAYERVALAVAYSVTNDAGGAGDVVQDAFLKAWQRVADLKEPEKFGGWLCGIVRNLAIDAVRARAVRAAVHGQREDGPFGSDDACREMAVVTDGDPLAELDRRDRSQRVARALQRLDEMSRSALVLRYYDNLSSRQIGELLGLAPTAVDMRLMRARRQLRGYLADLEEGNGEPSCVRGRQSAGEV